MTPKAPYANCAECPGRDRPCVPPEPATIARVKLAIVGEGPGRNEVQEGRPFIGASGRMMMRGLKTIGVQRHEAHWTNAILCDVAPRDLPAARKCCAERLRRELAGVGAPVVLPVGSIGARSALLRNGATSILRWRGSVSRIDYGEAQVQPSSTAGADTPVQRSAGPAWVLPTIHPAFVMRSPHWGRVLEIDVARVGRVMRQGFVAPEDAEGRRTIVARTEAELGECLEQLTAEYEGFDVETVGLGPTHTALVCFALSDGALTVIVPWASKRDGSASWWASPGRVARMVSAHWRKRVVVTHNGPAFDHIVAERYGLEIREWDDTLLQAHALSPELPKNLAHVVTLGLDVGPWKLLEDRTADLPRLWTYNGRDTLYMTIRFHQLRDALRDAA